LEKGRKPAAVLISLEDYKKRFVEKEADERRRELQEKIRRLAIKSNVKESSEELVRALRWGKKKIHKPCGS
jgi:PHD/YefM family antitoxin component YafN of YafNO toxin-antitoxin module